MPLKEAEVAAEPGSGPGWPSVTPEYVPLSLPSLAVTALAAVVPEASPIRQ